MNIAIEDTLPVIVIGAGPVGLAAASRLLERRIRPLVLERGPGAGSAIGDWGHVRVFSPWTYNVDGSARTLLEASGWQAPDPEALPTGKELVRDYLAPLAALPALAPNVVYGATVEAVTRAGLDKVGSSGREVAPLSVRWRDAEGRAHRVEARAVIDASCTWGAPNPLGIDGLPVEGERENARSIDYGIPDVLGRDRADYAGLRILVVGGGHSAINVALDLLRLQEEVAQTRVTWALRRDGIDRLVGGGLNDQLPERGELGLAARRAIEAGRLQMLAPFVAERIWSEANGLGVAARHGGRPVTLSVDRIVVATGFRPELEMLRELRVALDPVVEAPPALAPLIDPNLHSCGTVPPHGAVELAHPEPGFYIVGAKSYGRAPTFLMATGYEQVRSVVAEIAGDHAAAREVRLVLPETGVCSAGPAVEAAAGCCGGAAPAGVDACCVLDAAAKAAGERGCGCSEPAHAPADRATVA
jgi:thioredoxin reductase